MYEWIKTIHVISLISWFAVLFYLPRLFVYHAERKDNEGFVEVVRVMEHKLFKIIGVPAFWATLITGTWMLVLKPEWFQTGGWIHAKLTLVAILIGYFFYLGKIVKDFALNTPQKSGKFYRYLNEVPTLLMIVIVILVMIKPF